MLFNNGGTMRQESKGVTEALLESATKEFLKEGYMKASLRKISSESKVSTNSIYTRFKDKEGLFNAIVEESAKGLIDLYLKYIGQPFDDFDFSMIEEAGDQGTYAVLEYIYQHFTEFKLIFCCSAGTKYERFLDELGEIEESYYKKFIRRFSKPGYQVDDFFIHIICRNGWQFMYEVVAHDKTFEEAQSFINSVELFDFAGWQAIMGLK